jgi:hypothetical protein
MANGYYPFYFASDLHGRTEAYRKLFSTVMRDRPQALFLGGDLLPSGSLYLGNSDAIKNNFIDDFLVAELHQLQGALKTKFPQIFMILGNDDARIEEAAILRHDRKNLWKYLHNRKTSFMGFQIYGYACVPPTPFILKDWERYDVSHFVDPGALAPEEGRLTSAASENEIRDHKSRTTLTLFAAEIPLTAPSFFFMRRLTKLIWIVPPLTVASWIMSLWMCM